MISVIIPIYNNESVLERCLKSVQNQTYTDIEVLMINDGSQDNSESICKQFEKSDKRFRYFYQDNSGVSVARNTGICNMKGEFFTFVDSDDWIEPDYCRCLIYAANINKSDMAFCGVNYCYDGMAHPQPEPAFPKIVENRRVEYFLVGHKEYVIGSCWRVLYRSEKYKPLRFDEHFHIYEDLTFLLTAISMTRKLTFTPDYLYNYELPQADYFKKYYRKNFLDICYDIGRKLYEILMQFGYDDWAKAELFKEYCLAADWLCTAETDKARKFNELKAHILAKEFCVKDNFIAYKNLYTDNDRKAKFKAKLLFKKHYRSLLLFKSISAKLHRNSNG